VQHNQPAAADDDDDDDEDGGLCHDELGGPNE